MTAKATIYKVAASVAGMCMCINLFLAVYYSPLPVWVQYIVYAVILFFIMGILGSMGAAANKRYTDIHAEDILSEEEEGNNAVHL